MEKRNECAENVDTEAPTSLMPVIKAFGPVFSAFAVALAEILKALWGVCVALSGWIRLNWISPDWHGKAAVIVLFAIIALALFSSLFSADNPDAGSKKTVRDVVPKRIESNRLSGTAKAPDFSKVMGKKYSNCEDLAYDIVKVDVEAHWDDFHKPLKCTKFLIEEDIAIVGCKISFSAVFRPEGNDYYLRATSPDRWKLPEDCDYEFNLDQLDKCSLDTKTKEEFRKKAERHRPCSMIVFRKALPEELDLDWFEFRIQYSVWIAKTNDDRFRVDPSPRVGSGPIFCDTAGYRKRERECRHVFTTAEFVNADSSLFPILAAGKTLDDWIVGKQRQEYEAFRNAAHAMQNIELAEDALFSSKSHRDLAKFRTDTKSFEEKADVLLKEGKNRLRMAMDALERMPKKQTL